MRFAACLAALVLVLSSNPQSYGQISPRGAAVEQALRELIVKLQATPGHPLAGGSAESQWDLTQLPFAGEPEQLYLSKPVPADGLFNFSAIVLHAFGITEWSFETFASGQIVAYQYTVREIRSAAIVQDNHHDNSKNNGPSAQPSQSIPTPKPPAVDPRLVEFLFASTRAQVIQPPMQNITYSGERGSLSYGAASVRIPDDHKIGHIELPASWSLFGITWSSPKDEHEHFIIKRVVMLSEDQFGQVVRAKGAKTALVFIHGFNNSFEDSLYREAQIVWDLQYHGLPVLFTWASRGETVDYEYDRESAILARDAFIGLIQMLKRDYGIEEVDVLAHSMGNVIALDALATYARTSDPVKISHLIMAAPDIDRDQFDQLAPKAKAIVGGMTLYASSADRAMTVSKTLAGGIPRAGDVPAGGPIVLPGLETIDVTAVGNDVLGLNHNVFAASRDVIEDIAALLRSNRPAPRLIQIHAVPEPPAPERYWRYVP